MDKLDAIEYLNQSKYFFGIENYKEALNYVNKGLEVDRRFDYGSGKNEKNYTSCDDYFACCGGVRLYAR